MRRLRRDINERGRTFERTLEQYERTIRPMHFEFVEPSKRHADVIIPEGGQMGVSVEFLCSLVREKLSQQETINTRRFRIFALVRRSKWKMARSSPAVMSNLPAMA